MRSRKWAGLLLPLMIVAVIAGMHDSERRHLQEEGDHYFLTGSVKHEPFLITNVLLSDTLSHRYLTSLGIADVQGMSMLYPSRAFTAYFEYRADRKAVFRALELLPFRITDQRVDLSVRAISERDLEQVRSSAPEEEILRASAFWSRSLKVEQAYEFIKPPFRHIIVVSGANEIRHRVQFAG